ncbi:alpha/beta hydrolase family protein [Cohnella sp. GCM10020058]|uniref:alpha/beta hydrolase family protein n=1 Tax=Cohnella sp. GCM10020058 TaxID=3317330 RepID=UPI0036389A6F
MKKIRYTGPWDVERLMLPLAVTWGETVEHSEVIVSQLCYNNELYEGKSTKVFAYYAVPKRVIDSLVPGVVLVHGGGGRAYSEWAVQWAERGYAAIAMDLTGRGADRSRMSEGGPDMTDDAMFHDISKAEGKLQDMWNYHAVAAAIRAVSFLATQSYIDPASIGIMGISWGGYVTEIVTGIESRLAFAIVVYAAGYYEEGSCWQEILWGMDAEHRQRWNTAFDVNQYIGQSDLPMLWATGTNDRAFYLNSWEKTYGQAKGARTLRLLPNWEHDYNTPWSTQEFFIYADSFTKDEIPLLRVTSSGQSGTVAWAYYEEKRTVQNVNLLYTTDSGSYDSRNWQLKLAARDDREKKLLCTIPVNATAYCFLIEDSNGLKISSDLVIIKPI